MPKKKSTSEDKLPKFEESLAELESIVRRLEQGGGSLEDALGDYARAIELLKGCHVRLEEAERRVEILSGFDSDGNPISTRLENQTQSLEEKQANRSSRRSTPPPKPVPSDDENGLF